MALTSKPHKAVPSPAPNVQQIEAFIGKGGSAPVSTVSATEKAYQHPLKFPVGNNLFARLEAARKANSVTLPRNTWILQAIAEKLDRDAEGDQSDIKKISN